MSIEQGAHISVQYQDHHAVVKKVIIALNN